MLKIFLGPGGVPISAKDRSTSGGLEKVLLCIGDVTGVNDRRLRDFQENFNLDELSLPSQAAVHSSFVRGESITRI